MKIPTSLAPLKGAWVRGGGGGLRDPYHPKYPKQAASIVPTRFNDSKIPRTRLVD